MRYHREFRDDGSLGLQFMVDENGRTLEVRAFDETGKETELVDPVKSTLKESQWQQNLK